MASSKSELNQPIWESSRRLLHPKCVWIGSIRGVSNGAQRHFIFDHSLTNAYRTRCDSISLNSHINNRNTRIEKSQSFDTVETKMDGLTIVGAGDRIQNTQSLNALNDRPELIADICFENEFYDTLELPENVETITPIDISGDNHQITSGMKRISNEIDSSKNLLAERVLQWLDLAGGRGGNLSAKRTEHMSKTLNATKRRSVTAKEQRKICTELQQDPEIKPKCLRREPLHQMSMTFNEVLNVKDLSARNFFGDLFPTTYKCSRKFLTLRRPKNSIIDSLEPLDLQSSLPIKSMARKSIHTKLKPKRLEYCDDQYRSLIQREILETSCNTQAAKRQLHIFMPNFPKRCLIVNDCDVNATNATHSMSPKSIKSADNSSCLSYHLAST